MLGQHDHSVQMITHRNYRYSTEGYERYRSTSAVSRISPTWIEIDVEEFLDVGRSKHSVRRDDNVRCGDDEGQHQGRADVAT